MNPRVLVIVNSASSGPRRLGTWLREKAIDVDEVVGAEQPLPASLDGYAGLVMLGGGLMPDDDDRAPWLAAERALAAEAIDRDLPTLGICLGGQLLAHVAGGEVADRITWQADERVERIVGSWPGRWDTARATRLGLKGDGDFAEIIRAYIADDLPR